MTFPALFTVQHETCNGFTENDDGNTIPTYSDPVDRPAYCWAPHIVETRADTTYLETADLDLFMPKTVVGLKDLFIVDGSVYEVVDVQDWTKGFHGWAPGIQVMLKKWEG